MKLNTTQLAVIALVIIIGGSILGWWSLGQPTTPTIPTPIPTPTEPTKPGTHPAAQIQWTAVNYITSASITTADIEVCKAVNGVFDFMVASEQKGADSAPEQSSTYFAEGDKLIIHIEDDADPTGGEDYYDQWYYMELKESSVVYRIRASNLQAVQTSPTYKYKISSNGEDTGERVKWTSGTTNYWDIGRLAIIPRVTDKSLHQYFKWQGTTMASMTDGATEVDTDGEITANVTLTTDQEDLIIQFVSNTTNLAWGVEQYSISSLGQFQARPTVIMFSTTMVAVSVDYLSAYGWKQIAASTMYAEKAFYYVVTPQIPVSGQKLNYEVRIPIDASAATASTKYLFKVWANDNQLIENVAVGAPSVSAVTAYGMIAGYGLQAMINDETLTISSGAGATETLRAYVTTAA